MAKFRKKPVVIDAVPVEVPVIFETLEGVMNANPGDWIITGVKGEKYPIKDHIFRETYDPADEEAEKLLGQEEKQSE